jgi:hypothetical protein
MLCNVLSIDIFVHSMFVRLSGRYADSLDKKKKKVRDVRLLVTCCCCMHAVVNMYVCGAVVQRRVGVVQVRERREHRQNALVVNACRRARTCVHQRLVLCAMLKVVRVFRAQRHGRKRQIPI